jgi:uncharacterized protein
MAAFRIEPAATGSKVLIHTDLMLSGAVAQYGRGVGMIQATAVQIINQFASNLRAQLAQQPAPQTTPARTTPAQTTPAQAAPPPTDHVQPAAATQQSPLPRAPLPLPPAAKPISGLSLMARVIWQQIVALFTGRPRR